MKKRSAYKKHKYILAFMMLIFVFCSVYVFALYNAKAVQPLIIKAVETYFNVQVDLKGKLEFSVSSQPSLSLHQLSVKKLDESFTEWSFEAENVQAKLVLVSLFRPGATVFDYLSADQVVVSKYSRDENPDLDSIKASLKQLMSFELLVINELSLNDINIALINHSGEVSNIFLKTFQVNQLKKSQSIHDAYGRTVVGRGSINESPFSIDGSIENLENIDYGQKTTLDLTFNFEKTLVSLKGNLDLYSIVEEHELYFDMVSHRGNYLKTLLPDGFPDIDKITLSTKLRGAFNSLSAEDLFIGFDINQASVIARGSIESLAKLENIDIRLSASGRRIDLFHDRLNSIAMLDKPFTFRANLNNKGGHFVLENTEFHLELPDLKLDITGKLTGFDFPFEYQMKLIMAGSNLKPWGELLSFDLPQTDSFTLDTLVARHANKYTVTELAALTHIHSNQISVQGKLDLLDPPAGPYSFEAMDLALSSHGDNALELSRLLDITVPENIAFKSHFNMTGSSSKVSVSNLVSNFEYLSSKLFITGRINDLINKPEAVLDFNVDAKENEFFQLLNKDWQDNYSFSASGIFNGDNEQFLVSDLLFSGEKLKTSGEIKVDLDSGKNIEAKLGETTVDLSIMGLADSPTNLQEPFNLDWMDDLNIYLSYELLKIFYKNVELVMPRSKLKMSDGKLMWNKMLVDYRGDKINNALLIDSKNDYIKFNAVSSQIDMGALLRDIEVFDRLQGNIKFNIELEAQGKSVIDFKQSLKGFVELSGRQLTIKDLGSVNLSYIRRLLPWREKVSDFNMDCLLVSSQINKGDARIKDFFISNENVVITGGGSFDINSMKYDFVFSPRTRHANFFQANTSLFLRGIEGDYKIQIDRLSTAKDVGLKYGQWAVLGPFALAIPWVSKDRLPSCDTALSVSAK